MHEKKIFFSKTRKNNKRNNYIVRNNINYEMNCSLFIKTVVG